MISLLESLLELRNSQPKRLLVLLRSRHSLEKILTMLITPDRRAHGDNDLQYEHPNRVNWRCGILGEREQQPHHRFR